MSDGVWCVGILSAAPCWSTACICWSHARRQAALCYCIWCSAKTSLSWTCQHVCTSAVTCDGTTNITSSGMETAISSAANACDESASATCQLRCSRDDCSYRSTVLYIYICLISDNPVLKFYF